MDYILSLTQYQLAIVFLLTFAAWLTILVLFLLASFLAKKPEQEPKRWAPHRWRK